MSYDRVVKIISRLWTCLAKISCILISLEESMGQLKTDMHVTGCNIKVISHLAGQASR
uniref:Uncharacterized protein n=1 Tax=Anguilla anguilla TaxID=7936 RepID=A0A0E9RSN9_ANGAN